MKRCTLTLFLIGIVSMPAAHAADVRVWEGTLTLPASEEGPPDVNPPFDAFGTVQFSYPYTLREHLTGREVEHAWRAVFLENEYLKCSVLPDIGGHVYTCLDKISGQPMFYANPSIKKAQIGYRGAWAAFGIEFNFPVSHNWVSMSPVDYAYAKHDDGSASITVGNTDRVYGMRWTVEMVLRPESTVLEQHVALYNRSSVRRRFYWWSNAGVEVWDDTRICYPMRWTASHGFTEVDTWPVDASGTDVSVLRNQTKGPVSLFVHGSREPFMGIWNPKTNTGVAHYAEYGQLPGKKIWSWGVDADALDWRHALSDNNSAYVEVQGGMFCNQETYAFLEPRQTIRFSEYWMPVRGLGGIARANRAGVLNLTRHGSVLVVGFQPNAIFRGAAIKILDGEHPLLEERVDLAPEHAWSKELALPESSHKYSFELRDASGAVLLTQTEGEYDWSPESEIHTGPQRLPSVPPLAERSEDDWLQLGKDAELNGRLLVALEIYHAGLQKFRSRYELSKAAGRLESALLRYDEAVQHLEAVQRQDTTDPEVAYYLGLVYEGRGETRKALTTLESAARLPSFHAAAHLEIGELQARAGDMQAAGEHFRQCLRVAPDDVRAAEELIAVLQAAGKDSDAHELTARWLARFPAESLLREQSGHPDTAHLAADPYRVLQLASTYMRLGLYKPALEVLSREYPTVNTDQSEPGAVPPQQHLMVAYFRAYCKEKLGQNAQADYAAASHLSTKYVFPSTAEELAVLTGALGENADDATAHYLLANLEFAHGQTDRAVEQWERARTLNPNLPVLHASMGSALLLVKHDAESALSIFGQGMSADPANEKIYIGIDQALSLLKRPASELREALNHFPAGSTMPAMLVYELALNRAEAGDYEQAEAVFHNRFFPRQEGGTNVRQVWVEVETQKALALAHAGNCATAMTVAHQLGAAVPGLTFTQDGLAPFVDAARTNYLMGLVFAKCGNAMEANARLHRASESTEPAQTVWAAAAARKLGNYDLATWRPRLEAALAHTKANIDTSSYPGWWVYSSALLQQALGHQDEAEAGFQKALLLPDRMLSYHLTRLARSAPIPE